MFNKFITAIFLALFVVACAQETPAPAAAGDMASGAAAAEASAVMPAGDAERGKRFYILCQACHTISAGGMNKVGPNLHGVVGRAAAQAEGFVYSEALANAGLTWDAATLNQWIARPAELVPGTTMVFAGIADAQQRADLIAYITQVAAE